MRFNFIALSAAICLIATVHGAPVGTDTLLSGPQAGVVNTANDVIKGTTGLDALHAATVNPGADVGADVAGKKIGTGLGKRGADTAAVDGINVPNVHDTVATTTGQQADTTTGNPTVSVKPEEQVQGVSQDLTTAKNVAGVTKRAPNTVDVGSVKVPEVQSQGANLLGQKVSTAGTETPKVNVNTDGTTEGAQKNVNSVGNIAGISS
ncbi:hypothetical protein DFQ28_005658 [Apophysomyces sp. BC1034]|nr:hypothetical protein DFQ29_004635 [Apophysomyces sp. BC1021]KAG0187926.1 hypothetical protein DFQ28_005658 [Apophysomyces sp. BC1034]